MERTEWEEESVNREEVYWLVEERRGRHGKTSPEDRSASRLGKLLSHTGAKNLLSDTNSPS